jgi:hypothetical protein
MLGRAKLVPMFAALAAVLLLVFVPSTTQCTAVDGNW